MPNKCLTVQMSSTPDMIDPEPGSILDLVLKELSRCGYSTINNQWQYSICGPSNQNEIKIKPINIPHPDYWPNEQDSVYVGANNDSICIFINETEVCNVSLVEPDFIRLLVNFLQNLQASRKEDVLRKREDLMRQRESGSTWIASYRSINITGTYS